MRLSYLKDTTSDGHEHAAPEIDRCIGEDDGEGP